jgi:rhamnogalacturonyl hydrolase YesR
MIKNALKHVVLCGVFVFSLTPVHAHGLLAEWWYNVSGSSITDLTSDPDYPNQPTGRKFIRRFESLSQQADHFGARVRGYIVPPADGDYTFWVAADDMAQLWLSWDAFADNKVLIASVPAATNPQQWDAYPQQQSAMITLAANHKYYIELLHKEDTSDNHFAVAWEGPGLNRQVIGITTLLPLAETLSGDLTGNHIVGSNDFMQLASHWFNADCTLDMSIDANGDCVVDIRDFYPLAQNWLIDSGLWNDTTLQIQENEFGYAGVTTGTIDSNYTGFTGEGFVNTTNAVGSCIEWHVDAATDGTYILQWRYANGSALNRTASLDINGTTPLTSIDFSSTGSYAAWNLSSSLIVTLPEGRNTLRLTAETPEGLANIDRLDVSGEHAAQTIIDTMRIANDYFMAKWPNPGANIVTDKIRPSNIWTRATYYEGLMALYEIDPQSRYYNYAVDWGESHNWNLRNGNTDTDADNQCCGQTYIDLYLMDPQPERLVHIKSAVDLMVNSSTLSYWSWIDALHMAMPVFARMGTVYNDDAYFEKLHQIYMYTKQTHGTSGLYNTADHLWWRDKNFDPPYVEPNGEDCYWSRGNGWVFAALVRVLDVMPPDAPHRQEYVQTFVDMAAALAPVQRSDGFWNVSLHDPTNYPGKELSGTAFFAYGFAWGVNQGLLDPQIYTPIALNAWNGMVRYSLHSNGFLGYVQSTASKPSDGQPLSYDKVPNFEDYTLGAFLLAAREIYQLTEGY